MRSLQPDLRDDEFGPDHAVDLFATAGFKDPFLASLIQSCVGLLAVIIYTFIVDRVGRRWPMSISYSIMCISCWLLGGIFYSHSSASHPVMVSETKMSLASRRAMLLMVNRSSSSVYGNSASPFSATATSSWSQKSRLPVCEVSWQRIGSEGLP